MSARIIGIISWWDESPTWLAASIASMGRFCDHVVALDGRYALYPDRRMQSGSAEHYAIIDAARAAGVGLTLHTAPRAFDDEMQKRTHLFRLALLEAEPMRDWMFVLDGDEVVVESPDKLHVHDLLASARERDERVLTATLWEKADPHQDSWRTELGMKLETDWRFECASPRFFLAHHDMRVEGYHYNYVGEDDTGNTAELWGQDGVVRERVAWGSLCGRVVLENRNRLRALARDRDRQDYYEMRDKTGLETIAPLAQEAHR
jgi:hypothetical protein